MNGSGQSVKLESPKRPGFRAGVKPCTLIGQKLGSLFEVPSDSVAAIDALLQQLDGKMRG